MDEIDALKALTAEPSPESAAAGRALLLAEARGAAPVSARRRFPIPKFALFTGAGLALAGATAAVAVLVSSGTATPRAPGGPGGAPDGGGFMQVAAKADLLPSGRFWHTDEVSGTIYVQRPASGASYTIFGAQTEAFHYTSAKPDGGEGFFSRELPARPATPQDEAAWKRAGSPRSFRVWSNDHYFTYSATRTTPWTDDSAGERGGAFPGPSGSGDPSGGRRPAMTAAQVAALPTDPDALAKIFFVDDPKARYAPGTGRLTPARKLSVAGRALKNMPLPPKVRAGLMRALAKQSGIQTVKGVADPLGRKGVALAAEPETITRTAEYGAPAQEQGTYTERRELLFNPDTGELLATLTVLVRPGGPYAALKPGAVIDYFSVRSSGWTQAKPKPPAGLPF
ncbi:hypothetical protein [Actinomadura rupiterrae]|uniref:hypothetical protein n=1 Tax=Actinomadura rupiterrae TaxID=559627 RepID=UPI0020A28B8F|nr:hypothetical protein [Actinomadura rupiterrae]MCP2337758.1 hypothetical protein [Actinomadura rupiterrae]